MNVLANTGLPMFGSNIVLAIALVPIIAVESLICWRATRLPQAKALIGVCLANAASTFVGFPATWFAMVFVNLATGGGGEFTAEPTFGNKVLFALHSAAWLPPSALEENRWMPPYAFIVLMIPMYLASVVIEAAVLRACWSGLVEDSRIGRISAAMNAVSYAGLIGFGLYWAASRY